MEVWLGPNEIISHFIPLSFLRLSLFSVVDLMEKESLKEALERDQEIDAIFSS